MDSKASTSSCVPTPVLKQCGQRGRSSCAPKRARFSMDDIEVQEFEVMNMRPLTSASSDQPGDKEESDGEYKMSISLRVRQARDESHEVNEARALWRAKRLSKKLESDDESHLGFPREWLTYFSEVIKHTAKRNRRRARARAASEATGSDDRRPVPGEVNRRHENAEVLFLDAVLDESLTCSVDGVEPASATSAEGAPTSANAKKNAFGSTWKSMSNGFVRVAEFTNNRLSSARSKLCLRGTRSQSVPHSTTSGGSVFRWSARNRSRVHASFESVVPHHDS
eukprot:TRINITY_DN15185_c0_g1_i1.p1 TRINITY_DN15185_c0_g1~~TRINITY_DN15185_c0_g1_i1.p1  ORF type:complete len:281 (+),score=32.90 TRINITY_DN15185_c0_g1_i1:58-900(+)